MFLASHKKLGVICIDPEKTAATWLFSALEYYPVDHTAECNPD
ncbi:MAG: hypothetical protein R8K22_01110 [Mariprofundaceae bacterium]